MSEAVFGQSYYLTADPQIYILTLIRLVVSHFLNFASQRITFSRQWSSGKTCPLNRIRLARVLEKYHVRF